MGMGSSFCFWFSQIGDEEDDHRCEDGWGMEGKGLLDSSATGVEWGVELSGPAELLTCQDSRFTLDILYEYTLYGTQRCINGAELSGPVELLTLTCMPHILST